jgi:hypothetical protein
MNKAFIASGVSLQVALAKVQAYQEAKRGIDDALEWVAGAHDTIAAILQAYIAANGVGPTSHALDQAVQHLNKTGRALTRAQGLAQVGIDVLG